MTLHGEAGRCTGPSENYETSPAVRELSDVGKDSSCEIERKEGCLIQFFSPLQSRTLYLIPKDVE
jgi:hypothetical protein